MKKNLKGFTLIELLAVIVILGVLLAIAIPSVAKYINTSKKNTYIENAQSYAKAARSEALIGVYQLPISQYQGTLITFKKLETALENGGITSSYGGTFDEAYSYVVIVNEGTAEEPRYIYYIAAHDSEGYGIGKVENNTASPQVLAYDAIKEANIVQLGNGTGSGVSKVAKNATMSLGGHTVTITNVYQSTN